MIRLSGVGGAVLCAVSCVVCAGELPVDDGLRFHVEAGVGVTTNSSGCVTRWADQSGNGFDVVQSSEDLQPVACTTEYGDAVYFNSTNWMGSEQSSIICYSNHTVIVVAKPDRTYNGSCREIGDLMGSNSSGGYGTGDILMMCNWDSGKLLRAAIWGSSNHYVTSDKGNTTDLVLMEQSFDGSTLYARVNGSYCGSLSDDFSDFTTGVKSGVLLGGRSGNASNGLRFHGHMFEILVYDRAVTAEERRLLVSYLAKKWSIPNCTSSSTPEVSDGLCFRMDARDSTAFSTNADGRVASYVDTSHDVAMEISGSDAIEGRRPIYDVSGTLPAMHFDGSNYIYSTTSTISYDNHDIFLVIKPATTDKIGDLFLSNASGAYGNGDALIMCNWDSDAVMRAAVYASSANYYVKPANFAKTDERIIIEQTFDGSTLYARVNGTYANSLGNIPSFSKSGGVNIGGRPTYASSGSLFNGDVYEVRVYDRVLTDAERRTTVLEMADAWNVEDAYIEGVRLAKERLPYCPVTNGLAFWCDAAVRASIVTNSSGLVSCWYDISGNGNNVSQTTSSACPSYSCDGFLFGKPCVTFSGGQILYGGSVCYSNHTVFVVATPAALSCGEDMFSSFYGTKSVSAGGVLILANKNSRAMRGLYAYSGTSYINTSDASFGSARTIPTIYEQRGDDTSIEASALSRGMSRESVSVDHTATPVGDSTSVSLGGRVANESFAFQGTYAEVLVYERALTDEEVETVEEYLTNKWFAAPDGTLMIFK